MTISVQPPFQIRETYENCSEDHIFNETNCHDPHHRADRGALFLFLQQTHGRCVSTMFWDNADGRSAVGWVFEKRIAYLDCPDTYLCRTWVHLRQAEKPDDR